MKNVNQTLISSPNALSVSESKAYLETARIWAIAARPKTLGAVFAPVLMGSALAYQHGFFNWTTFVVTLLCGTFIQVATNLINDYFDFLKGADTDKREGPTRVMQSGLVSAPQMQKGIFISLLFASLLGSYLIYLGGWPILLIGVLSLVFSFLYTAGPFSLAYMGLGEIFVFVFFGPVAVAGTYYVQTLSTGFDIIMVGFAPGLLSTALIAVNNLRDKNQDAEVNKKTLAVRYGSSFAQALFATCMLGAAVIPAWLIFLDELPMRIIWLSLLSFLIALKLIKDMSEVTYPAQLNRILARVGIFLLIYGFLFSIGLLI